MKSIKTSGNKAARLIAAGILCSTALSATAQTASPFGFEDNTVNGWAGTASSETVAVNSAVANIRTGGYSLKITTTSTGTGNKQWYSNTPYATAAAGVYIHFIYWAKAQDANTSVDGSFRYASAAPPSGTGSSANAASDVALSTGSWKRVTNNVTTGSTRYYFPGPRKTVSTGATSFYLDDGILYTSGSSTTDTIKPLPAASLSGTVNGNLVSLSWAPGTDTGTGASGIAAAVILRTSNLTAAAPELNDQAAYSVAGGAAGPNAAGSWTVIHITTTAAAYTDATSAPGSYKYAVVMRDLAHNYAVAALSPALVAGTPVPTVFTAQAGFNGHMGNVVRGRYSAVSSYTVSGLNLTAPITVTAPAGFEVSTSASAGFVGTLSLPQNAGTVAATPVFVRFAPTAATGATGNATITNTSGAASQTIAVSGNALDEEPAATGTISFNTVRSTRIGIDLPTAGSGSRRIIVASEADDVTYIPLDGVAPAGVNSDFSAAANQGRGNKIVYDGAGSGSNVVLVTGLTPGTIYYFAVYEYNSGSGTSQNYLPASPVTAVARTADNDLSVAGAWVKDIKVYPNPAGQRLFIAAPAPVAAMLISPDGKVVYTGSEVSAIDLSNIAAGIYLLQLKDGEGRFAGATRISVVK